MFPKYDIGKNGELYVRDIFIKCGFLAELNNDYQKRYDYDITVNCNNLICTLEVKHDILSLRTNNIAIETFNCKSNTMSGINSTLSDIWIQLLPQKNCEIYAYAISTKRLKDFIKNNEPLKATTKSGDKNSNLSIYTKESIIQEFTRIDNITNSNILYSEIKNMIEWEK